MKSLTKTIIQVRKATRMEKAHDMPVHVISIYPKNTRGASAKRIPSNKV